ncbi:preprotein translocase subunit YajC [Arthrobacter sp. B0490]|uniref:preprotein translocase subunit YajC n=1 Tax=Arthrobacter sp. B0490 TaxID=2058891 RepID=UPI0015E3A1F0|nr:preprotein translocase subunit YajC [Arthrobacter sp. B0490]
MLAHVVAQNASGDAPAFDIFSLLLPLALAFLIFTMFRRQRKTQQQVKEMRTQMEPGTEVMTQFGLYGTIVSIDQENNKAVLELSPGNLATVHTQALSKVVQQEPAVVDATDSTDSIASTDAAVDGTTVPDDASSLSGDLPDRTPTAGSTAAGTAGAASGVESPEETRERLNREAARENRDPRANPDH